MKRRELLKTIGAIVAGWKPLLGLGGRGSTYGYVDVQTAQARGWTPAIVLVNGFDVSQDCCACDDIEGYAVLYKRSEIKGRLMLDERGDVATEIRRGVITFVPTLRVLK